jgi:hypothetical protein
MLNFERRSRFCLAKAASICSLQQINYLATNLIEALFILSIFYVREVPAVLELTYDKQVNGLEKAVLGFDPREIECKIELGPVDF